MRLGQVANNLVQMIKVKCFKHCTKPDKVY
jgi:hypothetical protein